MVEAIVEIPSSPSSFYSVSICPLFFFCTIRRLFIILLNFSFDFIFRSSSSVTTELFRLRTCSLTGSSNLFDDTPKGVLWDRFLLLKDLRVFLSYSGSYVSGSGSM